MRKFNLFLLLGTFVVLISCNDTKAKKKYLPSSTGGVNSLIVVIDNELWEGGIGDKVREYFARPALGLSPEQAIFTITQIPPQVFSGAVTQSRSILFVQQDTLSLAHIKTDVYASPQKIAVIKGEGYNNMATNIDSLANRAITSFKALELQEAQKRFTRSLSKEKQLQEEFGISLDLPSAYQVGKHEENFVWIDRQIQKGTMNVIAYTMPENSFENDTTFVSDILKMRDSIGKKYIPGPDVPGKKTYMITERAFAPYVFPAEINGMKAVEVRGIWEMKNYPMAGPFLTYIINDKANKRKLVIEGFAFAPSTQKREYMFELEALLKTIKLEEQARVP